ncbi:MAG TPA: ATP-binding protein, partial [Vicinamibacterales bacterium]|nr:ATP-binding protein [Vicinamibacterales bacterium]
MPSRRQPSAPAGQDERTAVAARLFDRVQVGACVSILGPDGTDATVAVNTHLKLIFGYDAATDDRVVLPFETARFVDPLARSNLLERLAHDGAVSDFLVRVRRVDFTPIWVEVTAQAERLDDGHLQVEALVRDVSDRKKLDDQTRDLYSQLLQAEKLASLGQTISGIAHELNNPLATVLTWAERLAPRQADANTKRGLEVILSEADRAARIVRNLLTFARKRHTTRTMVDLNQVVGETLALRSYEQRVTNITVISALAAGLPHVFADPHQIQQVLLNLVINAEQAMLTANGRGTLVVRTWHDASTDTVVLEVNDDGPGIGEETQAKVFDPFFTTKEVGKGTGLGLTVAYAIVKEHGGRIWVRGSEGQGASFFVELPTGEAQVVRAPHPPPVEIKAEVPNGTRVLVVEDEMALAAAVQEGLTDAGFEVDHAADGEEALARVEARAYDLIVCDLKMPRVDGMQFYRAIAAGKPALARRVIFCTGDVVGAEAERFLEESGCRWL